MRFFCFIGNFDVTFRLIRLLVIIFLLILLSCTRSVTLKGSRYVVLSPEIAEILLGIGVYEEIVGITEEMVSFFEDGSPFPLPLVSGFKPVIVGNFGHVSLEAVVDLQPSIVFTSGLEQNEITVHLSKLNIQTVQLYPRDLHDLYSVIDTLGVICDRVSEAEVLSNYLRDQFEVFRIISEVRQNKPRVFIEIYGNPIMTADDSSYLGQLLALVGGVNIFPELARDYCMVNAEDVVKLDPEVIILAYPGVTVFDIQSRKGWGDVSAVLNNRIFTVDDIDPDLILRAGPRNVEGVVRLSELIYDM